MCAVGLVRVVGVADIDFMTPGERMERYSLVMKFPTPFEAVQAAKDRIQLRIAQREIARPAGASLVKGKSLEYRSYSTPELLCPCY